MRGAALAQIRTAALVLAAALSALGPAAARAQAGGAAQAGGGPLSAIDWLSRGLVAPPTLALPGPIEPPVSGGRALPEPVEVTPLGQPSAEAVGLLPVHVTGLPRDLWRHSAPEDLARRLERFRPDMLPAMRRLLFLLLLAELDPPASEGREAPLLLARVDTLMRFGAVDQALALLERAGVQTPAAASRFFDAALLTGNEDAACARILARPALAPGMAARIFCLARGGDWSAAALALEAARALGEVGAYEDALLERFLHPEAFEGVPPLAPPARLTPLLFRLFEAVGEPLPSAGLPLAYAVADLRPVAGWRAQIEAAERLARAGALPANRLLGLWTGREPAASGGIWERVAAVQRFDRALVARDMERVAATLPEVWAEMRNGGLESVFAEIYAVGLEHLPLRGEADALRLRIGLLSERYELYARARATAPTASAGARPAADPAEALWLAVATGAVADAPPPRDPFEKAVLDGFRATGVATRLQGLMAAGRLGEVLLRAIELVEAGSDGDTAALADGLATLRAVGLEGVARRAALEVLILERRG